MLRLEGLVLFRRESEGWMASGWAIGLVGGVENIGVAGESSVVGPRMMAKWVLSVLQVAVYLKASMLIEPDSRNGGREDGEQSPCQLTSPRRR